MQLSNQTPYRGSGTVKGAGMDLSSGLSGSTGDKTMPSLAEGALNREFIGLLSDLRRELGAFWNRAGEKRASLPQFDHKEAEKLTEELGVIEKSVIGRFDEILSHEIQDRISFKSMQETVRAMIMHEWRKPFMHLHYKLRSLVDPEAEFPPLMSVIKESWLSGSDLPGIKECLRISADGKISARILPNRINSAVEKARNLYPEETSRIKISVKFSDTGSGTAGEEVPAGYLRALFNAEPELVELIMSELVLNAVEAFGSQVPEGAEISVEAAFTPQGPLVLRVTDNGPGIPPGIINHVTEAGFTTKEDGTGHGLANIRYAVEDLMQGRFMIESAGEGKGASAVLVFSSAGTLPG